MTDKENKSKKENEREKNKEYTALDLPDGRRCTS